MKSTVLRRASATALFALILTALALRDRWDVATLSAWVAGAGAAGPVVFIAVYAAATVLFLPGALVTLAGGALFGPLWGTLWNLGGATLGAALAFLIARYLGAGWVSRRAGPRLQRLNAGVAEEGWRFVAFVRLVPWFPFNLLNYALGLTPIRFATYVAASAVFMLPGALAYTWLGHAGRQALGGDAGMVRNGLIALALLGAASFLPRALRRLGARPMQDVDALRQKMARGEPVFVLDMRDAAEFNGPDGHIPGATHLPLAELPARLAELDDRRRTAIHIVCRTDRRSAQAAVLLADAGFADVVVVRGGMTAWRASGGPSAPALNPAPQAASRARC
ncbi:MAG: VTT domain-containing protein [Burkholderiales bacterium]|nr:VTT domain-containing protein [Burkholderiales bacterium]